MPMVSFIVPVYNAEQYLVTCVSSLLKQTMPDFEIILVDDGSKDTSGEICDCLSRQDARIRTIHQINAGIGGARNSGMHAAAGDYIVFIDSDDFLEPDFLENAIPLIEQDGVDIVNFGFFHTTLDGQGEIVHRTPACHLLEGIFTYDELMPRFDEYYSAIPHSVWNRIYRRTYLVDNGLYFGNYKVEEDAFFTLDLFKHGFSKMVISHAAFYHYVTRAGSVQRRFQVERLPCELLLAERLEMLMRQSHTEHRLTNIVNERYVTVVALELNNIAFRDCPLSFAEKCKRIREAAENRRVREAIAALPLSAYSTPARKIKLLMLKLRLYRLCVTLNVINSALNAIERS